MLVALVFLGESKRQHFGLLNSGSKLQSSTGKLSAKAIALAKTQFCALEYKQNCFIPTN
ncbi:MAG: hypothetical protein AAFR63_11370 [Cyanobacteria bacterium J06631_6]